MKLWRAHPHLHLLPTRGRRVASRQAQPTCARGSPSQASLRWVGRRAGRANLLQQSSSQASLRAMDTGASVPPLPGCASSTPNPTESPCLRPVLALLPRPRRGAPMTEKQPNGLTYAQVGVDIDAGNAMVDQIKPLVRATQRPGADAEIGGFGGLFDLKAAGFRDPILVAANDGVGTKVKIAIDTGIHDTIGIDLVAMCVNDIVVQGAEPLFFLDYFATGKLSPEVGVHIVKGIAEGCLQAGCALIGGETAEMPGLYAKGDYDLAGFAVGAAERGTLLPKDVSVGDVLIGLPSSGVHSNGFSLVRRIVEHSGLEWDAPAPFAADKTLAQALLEPTRIYVKALLEVLKGGDGINALCHITGG